VSDQPVNQQAEAEAFFWNECSAVLLVSCAPVTFVYERP